MEPDDYPGVALTVNLKRLPARKQSTLVLMYHRVDEPVNDPFRLCVTPRHFAEQLEVIRRLTDPVPLSSSPDAASWSRPRVIVTFDDGYLDNFVHALPALEAAEVPATIFVVAETLGSSQEFWWDQLEQCFRGPWPAPRHVELRAGAMHATGEVFSDERSLRAVHHFLLQLPPRVIATVLVQLRQQLGLPEPVLERRAMTPEELGELAASELIEIGGHTCLHPNLVVLPVPERQAEMENGRAHLEQLLDRPVDSFSYPYGSCDPDTIACAGRAGFARACAVAERVVPDQHNRLAIPRLTVENWDGAQFERQLSGWLGLAA